MARAGSLIQDFLGVRMFTSKNELITYVVETYPQVTDARVDEDHWDLECTVCKITRGFQLIKRWISCKEDPAYGDVNHDFDAPVTYLFRCPVCKAFKQ
jgi:hypothetical protein